MQLRNKLSPDMQFCFLKAQDSRQAQIKREREKIQIDNEATKVRGQDRKNQQPAADAWSSAVPLLAVTCHGG